MHPLSYILNFTELNFNEKGMEHYWYLYFHLRRVCIENKIDLYINMVYYAKHTYRKEKHTIKNDLHHFIVSEVLLYKKCMDKSNKLMANRKHSFDRKTLKKPNF